MKKILMAVLMPVCVANVAAATCGRNVLFTDSQLASIRERVANERDAGAWWSGHVKKSQKILEKKIDVPSRGAKWWHLYSCSACGGTLKMKSPTEHACRACGKLHMGEPYDGAALIIVHGKYADDVRDLGIAHAISGDAKFAAKCGEILLAYAGKYKSYPLLDRFGKSRKGGGYIMPQALDEAVWLVKVLQGYDCVRDALDADVRRRIENDLLLPAASYIKTVKHGIHNHECWHIAAWGLAGIVLGKADWVNEVVDGKLGFREQIEKGVTKDGPWFEGAWGYHFYTLMSLQPLAVALSNIGRMPQLPNYKAMYMAPFAAVTPTWELPAFHDTSRMKFSPKDVASKYELATKLWPDEKLFRWVVAQGGRRTHEDSVLLGTELREPAEVAVPRYESCLWGDIGIAILRTHSPSMKRGAMPSNYIAVDYGRYGGWHGHQDKLGLVLWGRGRLLAEDPGCISYGNPAFRGWYSATMSHNTVMLDGQSQRSDMDGSLGHGKLGVTGKLLDYHADDVVAVASFDAGPVYEGATLQRHVAMSGDLVLDMFSIRCERERDVMWLFHSRNERGGERGGRPIATPDFTGAEWAKDWRCFRHGGEWNATWVETNGVSLALTQASAAGEVFSAIGRAQPPPKEFTLYANRVRGREALFASAFVISSEGSGERAHIVGHGLEPDGTCRMEVVCGNRRCVFVYTPRSDYEAFGERVAAGATLRMKNVPNDNN